MTLKNTFNYTLLVLSICIAAYSLHWAFSSINFEAKKTDKSLIKKKEREHLFSVPPGKNGILAVTIEDSLANVMFIYNKDTLALDALTQQEFIMLLDTLYRKL